MGRQMDGETIRVEGWVACTASCRLGGSALEHSLLLSHRRSFRPKGPGKSL